ncbi:hypothetical protein [Hoeflea halophila]|nr:hypothetical protein [Hoeflea halophila]
MAAGDNDINREADIDRAFRVNRISAAAMAFAVAAVLLLQRPELGLIFIAYVGVSVWAMSFARSRGILVRPLPAKRQNLAAYVALSTAGFFATLYGSPQVIELYGTAIYLMLAGLLAYLLLRGIVKSL